jgi:hypothetical protein
MGACPFIWASSLLLFLTIEQAIINIKKGLNKGQQSPCAYPSEPLASSRQVGG